MDSENNLDWEVTDGQGASEGREGFKAYTCQ